MDCEIGDNLVCVSCGRVASCKSVRRNCKPQFRGVTVNDGPPPVAAQPPSVVHGGPGTELKKLLSFIGIEAGEGCSCNSMAAKMDAAGADGSEAMIDEILSAMRGEARKR